MSEKTIVTEVWIEMSNNIKIYYDHFLADIKIPTILKMLSHNLHVSNISYLFES